MENLKPRPLHIDLAIAWSIWQGFALRFSHKDLNLDISHTTVKQSLWK